MQRGDLLQALIATAREAGQAVMEVYASTYEVSYKEDRSPLTTADKRSHEVIRARLRELTPDIPVLSEEGRSIPYAQRRNWREFYLVDPLDGTKEFINRNGEFTVNIALLRENRPVAGVMDVPALGTTYYAEEDRGAYRLEGDAPPRRLSVRGEPDPEGLTVVASRSHATAALEDYLRRLHVKELVSRGSALKFALVAEGRADIYPRLGPTWEWDTAAGHAILLEAGGRVLDMEGNPLAYNKESLKHAGFLALGVHAQGEVRRKRD
ncbi:MAG: 3'(2'),5'-bisphosphate nucleotidase CysQ [Nitrospirota bacterium]